jgi:poly(hydroxyalkanoate) depolymerase family esterase
MARRTRGAGWAKAIERSMVAMARHTLKAGKQAARALNAVPLSRQEPSGTGDWLAGVVMGAGGMRRYRLYRPPGVIVGEQLPLLVMLHGCGQDANSFARSTGMNRVAARQRFLVLYPEQDRLANAQRCWNWFDTRSGRAHSEADLIMQAVDQVCLLYRADRTRIAVAGLSAGASMAALLATRHPGRFRAVVMHSGIPPGAAHSGLSAIGAMNGRRGAASLPASAGAGNRWPPLMVIHGGQDRVVAASNGQAAVRLWADAAGARPVPGRSVQRGKRYPMVQTDFRCRDGIVATLVEVAQLGHAWSGGAASQPHGDVQGPDASRLAWAFAARQFRS